MTTLTGDTHRFAGRTLLLALCCLGLLLPPPAAAIDWLKSGKDLLRSGPAREAVTRAGLSDGDIAAGLKEALRVGSERVVSQVGALDGFNADPQIHIPLPGSLDKVRTGLAAIGKSAMLDDLELKLNRAAEQAAPKAKALFLQSIEGMTLEDVQKIYNGPEDAATRYFQGKMSAPLGKEMEPLVAQTMSEVGAVQSYDAVLGEYGKLPFVPDIKGDLNGYVVEKGMDGIFFYLAKEEAAIRENPVKRTTELLQKVFGAR